MVHKPTWVWALESSQTADKDVAKSEPADELRITVLGARNLPRISFSHGGPKAFVTLRVLDQTWSTDVVERRKSTGLEKEFNLQGDNSSVLKIELKVRRRFGFEHLVGATEVRFDELRNQRQAQS
ncbi:hypothetical protein BOTBODRAFT_473146 [Botryobasidium botryosum FD-172 SS1]|uniref:C2 domain-containing protein n=1 Tax=Botryobasidium botryosum (strain FD-172 SS1) TaxID=930990 RepID=A0A067M7S8_BOTB1|nr:hypothetical protein BOTBODRAFT_473146 [Botryobasidium botryosum FD-172 SS1]